MQGGKDIEESGEAEELNEEVKLGECFGDCNGEESGDSIMDDLRLTKLLNKLTGCSSLLPLISFSLLLMTFKLLLLLLLCSRTMLASFCKSSTLSISTLLLFAATIALKIPTESTPSTANLGSDEGGKDEEEVEELEEKQEE